MGAYQKYTELDVWKHSRALASHVYELSAKFPKSEQFGIVSQIRRCVVSVPSNIAEGCGRNYPKDSIQFFHISRGSLYELETQLYLSFDLNYIDQTKLNEVLLSTETTRKLLIGFIKYYQKLLK